MIDPNKLESEIRPYLSTDEVMRLANVSRRVLGSYEEKGAVTPRRMSDSSNVMLWTRGQANVARDIALLQRGGTQMKDIANIASDGYEAMLDATYELLLHESRSVRRELKNLEFRRTQFRLSTYVENRTTYLRYMPQRWLALVPTSTTTQFFPGQDRYEQLYLQLISVAEAVGWCVTRSAGTLVSLSADQSSLTSYAFTDLASPPMPAIREGAAIDGGCYYSVNPSEGNPGCDGTKCCSCARFGRNPSDKERERWSTEQLANPRLWARTLMADSMEKPYCTGTWAHDLTPVDPSPGKNRREGERFTRRNVRPRLMPHKVRLPMGVTACVMPPGTYLCQQCDEGEQQPTYLHLLGQASAIKQRIVTEEDEIEAARTSHVPLWRGRNDSSQKGPYMEPFAVPSAAADPDMLGWVMPLKTNDSQKLIVPTQMALQPEDGYCILCSALPPRNGDDPMRYELQLLVDASNIDPPPEQATSE